MPGRCPRHCLRRPAQPHTQTVIGTRSGYPHQLTDRGNDATLSAAILIDATVVRRVLLPAALSLLGDRAWRLRRRAGRYPALLRYQPSPATEEPARRLPHP